MNFSNIFGTKWMTENMIFINIFGIFESPPFKFMLRSLQPINSPPVYEPVTEEGYIYSQIVFHNLRKIVFVSIYYM